MEDPSERVVDVAAKHSVIRAAGRGLSKKDKRRKRQQGVVADLEAQRTVFRGVVEATGRGLGKNVPPNARVRDQQIYEQEVVLAPEESCVLEAQNQATQPVRNTCVGQYWFGGSNCSGGCIST